MSNGVNNKIEQLQNDFKEYLFTGANEALMLDYITERNHIPAQQRLDVYRNAYYIRLQEAIAHDFPTLLAAAGDERFAELVTLYIKAQPSTSPSLRDFGRALPQWLRARAAYALADVAAMEWAVLEAFDAADAEPLYAETLAGIPAEKWQELTFVLHPSLSVLLVSCNAIDLWSAVRNEATSVPECKPNEQQYLAVWRTPKGPAVQSIDAATYQLLSLLKRGRCFGDCCVELSQATDYKQAPELAATALALACNSGWIVAIHSGDKE